MKINLIILLLSLILILTVSGVISNKCTKIKWKKFIALGDSNTQMGFSYSQWLSRLANMYERRLDVINRGFGGYNSEHIRYYLKDIFEEFDASSVGGMTILIGTNDSTNKTNTLQHVPLDRYKENMLAIIEYLIKWGVKANKIILISPARIDDQKIQQIIGEYNTFSDVLVRDYAKACVEIASKTGVLFADVNKAMLDENDSDQYKKYLSDGLHFSYEGGAFLVEKLKNNFGRG